MPIGEAREALLLTAKARIVAPLVVWRRGAEDYLLLTEPESGERLARELVRGRFAAKCTIELEEHRSTVVLGEPALVGASARTGASDRRLRRLGRRALDAEAPDDAEPIARDELERLRILARTPRLGRELDDRVMPAEAGLEERAISFTKGCYPGQEPVARLHYRGRANRGLRVLALEGGELPRLRRRARRSTARSWVASRAPPRTRSTASSRSPTSGARCPRMRSSRWAAAASVSWAGRAVRGLPGYTRRFPAPVAQGIERCPAEAEVARSNRAGRNGRGNPWFPRRSPPSRLRTGTASAWPSRPPAATRRSPRGFTSPERKASESYRCE